MSTDLAPIHAIVDVGSNSTRLLLSNGTTEHRTTTVTGLLAGAAADGTIADPALIRLEAALTVFGQQIDASGAQTRVVVGTSAVRDAPNRGTVAEIVRRTIATPLRVVSGAEEAALAFAGARLAVPEGIDCLMVDIGGGSTELARADTAGVIRSVSLQLGCVRQTERHLHSDPPTRNELAALRHEAGALLSGAVNHVGRGSAVVGVAGTITTLCAIVQGGYDPARVHGARLSRDEIVVTCDALCAVAQADRERIPGLQPERAGVIVAGAIIALAALDALHADELVVSERDLLDGARMRFALDAA